MSEAQSICDTIALADALKFQRHLLNISGRKEKSRVINNIKRNNNLVNDSTAKKTYQTPRMTLKNHKISTTQKVWYNRRTLNR